MLLLLLFSGREPDAEDYEKELANDRLEELSEVTNQFILRRTNKLLARVLPPKLMLNVFCPLAPFQLKVYQLFLSNRKVRDTADTCTGMGGKVLGFIQSLMKLVNHPYLIRKPTKEMENGFEQCDSMFDFLDDQDREHRGINKPVRPFLSGNFLSSFHASSKQFSNFNLFFEVQFVNFEMCACAIFRQDVLRVQVASPAETHR